MTAEKCSIPQLNSSINQTDCPFSMESCAPNIQLLQASVDPEDESEFRILLDGQLVKYLTIDGGIFRPEDMCFEPALVSLLPPLPTGNWNTAHVSLHPERNVPYFSSARKQKLPGIIHIWHPTHVDHLESCMEKKLRTNVYRATSPRFSEPVLVKLARFAWEIHRLDLETAAYQWIEGQQIGPKFLGHLTEEGRVIGLLTELIPDCRHATPGDLSACQKVLGKLHSLGIRHGDINKHNFLIQDGMATLIDFDCAVRCNDPRVLEEEMSGLKVALEDTSGRGGVRSMV